MDAHSTWGAMLVAWLLIVPIIGAVISANWGGGETAAGHGLGRQRMAHDNASVPPDQVDYSATDGSFTRGAVRDAEVRDRGDPRGQPRH